MALISMRRPRLPFRAWLRDGHVLLAVAITVCALGIELVTDPAGVPALLPPVAVNLLAQVLGHRLAAGRMRPGLDTARLLLAVATVLWLSLDASAPGAVPLTMLYIPVVTMGAILGWRPALVVGAASVAATVLLVLVLRASLPLGYVEASGVDPAAAAMQRGATMLATMVVLAIGTRRTVGSLERAVHRARSATARSRRQARQMAAVEEVGRLLAASGPTSEALEQVMDVLVERFDYRFVSIYTVDGPRLQLGAQRGYSTPIESFDGSFGIVGRVLRTGTAELVGDVRADPDYLMADATVRSEVIVPLSSGAAILGVLSVGSDEARRLDASDRDTLVLIADRVASALALGRERQALRDRATMFRRLIRFGTAIDAVLGSEAVRAAVVGSVADLLEASSVTLVVREVGGEDLVAAVHGEDTGGVGRRIKVGEGVAGQAIVERRVVTRAAGTTQGPGTPAAVAAGAMPLIHDDRVIGAIAVTRDDPSRPFTALEIETMEIIASQVATTVANAALHDAIAEAAIRDPLTGLWNRRELSTGLGRLFAARSRTDPEVRRPVAAILFDLDKFGAFNKRHGHATGDAVLRTFGGILTARLRASDLVARYGGEEFIVVLDGATVDEAMGVAEEIRRTFEEHMFEGSDDRVLRATVSAGCAALGPDVASFEALLERTDVALQMAKRGGRNQVVAA